MNRLNNYELAEYLTSQLEQRNIDITDNYNDWVEIGAALSTLGNDGRELFHRISRLSNKYNTRQCDTKYNNILRWNHNFTLGTLIFHCRKASIDIPSDCKIAPPTRVNPISPQPSTERIVLPAITTISNSVVEPTLANHSGNVLFDYMASFYGYDTVKHVWEQYRVGTSRKGETVFWQHDALDKCRGGKIMAYNKYGHRQRDRNVDWVHSRLKIPDYVLDQVLFGTHLIDRHLGWVSIVESEKTALIAMCHVNPTCHPEGELFLATGGSCNLTLSKVKAIGYRPLRLYPDRDCVEKWTSWAENTPLAVPNIEIMTLPDNLGPTADYADMLIRYNIQNRMLQNNATLI